MFNNFYGDPNYWFYYQNYGMGYYGYYPPMQEIVVNPYYYPQYAAAYQQPQQPSQPQMMGYYPPQQSQQPVQYQQQPVPPQPNAVGNNRSYVVATGQNVKNGIYTDDRYQGYENTKQTEEAFQRAMCNTPESELANANVRHEDRIRPQDRVKFFYIHNVKILGVIQRFWSYLIPCMNHANIYLHMLDNFVVNDLNTKNYVRYMDDFVIGLNDYNKACSLITILSDFLFNNLRLTLKPTTNAVNTNIFPYEFLGYTIYKNGSTFIRDSIVKDLIKEIIFYKYNGYSYEELFRNRLLYVLNALYFIKDFNAYNYIISLLYYYNIQSPILDRTTKEENDFNKDFGVYMKSFFKKYL